MHESNIKGNRPFFFMITWIFSIMVAYDQWFSFFLSFLTHIFQYDSLTDEVFSNLKEYLWNGYSLYHFSK